MESKRRAGRPPGMTEQTRTLSRKVLKLRRDGLTLRAIGSRLRLSKSRVHQLAGIAMLDWTPR